MNERLEDAALDPHEDLSPDAFRKRIGIYEAATEPLARMFGVFGRWGEGGELTIVLDVVGALWSGAKDVRAGRRDWLSLGSYPAVLLVAAYGIGLVRAERWGTLHELFVAQIDHKDGAFRGRVVDELFLQSWSGGEQRIWKQLEGLERRTTPLSDHLLAAFSPWSDSFVGIVPEFEGIYETWEVLGCLVYWENYSLETIREAHARMDPLQSVVRGPYGRSALNDQNRERILNRIQGAALKEKLLISGFANGDKELFAALIENLRRMAGRLRWF